MTLFAICSQINGIARLLKRGFELAAQIGFILDDQNAQGCLLVCWERKLGSIAGLSNDLARPAININPDDR